MGGRTRDITTRCEPGTVPVAKSHLLAAVAELVDNALRFSVASQPVAVTGSTHAAGYRIEVLDQGEGMTPEQCAQIGPFIQFDRDRREQQGLGLGLAIVQSVAAIAHGNLRLAPGPGSRGLQATLDLPLA
jgi:signal transduction histidine kinase